MLLKTCKYEFIKKLIFRMSTTEGKNGEEINYRTCDDN